MILYKRLSRDFKENLLRNTAMILIIALSMAMVVALCSTTDAIRAVITDEWERSKIEDGAFETYIPLSPRNLNELKETGASVEKMFYTDVPAGISVLRLFKPRQAIDLAFVEEGHLPSDNNGIFIDKLFAKSHFLAVGDTLTVGDRTMKVTGIGCLPDYCYIKENTSDVAANDEFSVAIVSDSAWESLKTGCRVIYNYAYRLPEDLSQKDFKNKIIHLKADYSAVTDTYLKGQYETSSSIKEGFTGSADSLRHSVSVLSEGVKSMRPVLPEDAYQALFSGINGIGSGIYALEAAYSDYISESAKIDPVIISSFSEAEYNIRIKDALDDSSLGKQAALVVGVFLIILLMYMLSIFASGTVEKERSVIGTLYSLGFLKSEILSYYIKIPLLISALGAVIGTVSGVFLTYPLSSEYSAMYSFPDIKPALEPYLAAYAIGVPVIFSYLINRLVLSKKLNLTPLEMMHASTKEKRRFNFRIKNSGFKTKYKIRQFFREFSGNITLFFGINVSLLLIMFSVACYYSIMGYINGITSDIGYNYMYVLRNPVTDLPKDADLGFVRGFYTDYDLTGGEMEVSLLGIDSDNPYFPFSGELSDNESEIYMSDSARVKFGFKTGDKVILRDASEDRLYSFVIAGEVKYSSGLYFFMNIDAMRKAFSLPHFDPEDLDPGEKKPKSENFYYNAVFSNEKLTFRHNMMMSEISKEDMQKGAEKFISLMSGMIVLMIAISLVIFIAVMYLLMKLEIDRSSYSISLLKALGYSEREVNSFYLGSSLYMTLASIAIGMPAGRLIVGAAYPFCVSNVNAGFEAYITPEGYVFIIAIIFLTYALTRFMLERYLKKISLSEILKNRE